MIEPFDEPGPFPEPASPKKYLPKVVGINLAIFFSYMVYFCVHEDPGSVYSGLEDFIMNALFLAAQIGLNWLGGLIFIFNPKHKQLGISLFIGGFILAVAGAILSIALEDNF